MYDIYLITNLINNKKYVGITSKGYKSRFHHHCSQGYYLTSSIKKHGKSNFKLELLLQVETKEEACSLEIKFIKELDTKFPNGYNFTDGGQAPTHTKEVKEKISEKLKGKSKSPEHIKKIQANAKIQGQKRKGISRPEFSQEWKDNMSKTRKAKFAHINKKVPRTTEQVAQLKWKPIYCVELDVTFLSSKFASEVLNIKTSSIATALMRNTKIHNYTFQKVSK